VEWCDVEPGLAARVAERFSRALLATARLPEARATDLRDSCELRVTEDQTLLRLTCTITGSTFQEPWDGSDTAALALGDRAADDTAYLVSHTRHYAWLRSGA
jgi:hypothetical protein